MKDVGKVDNFLVIEIKCSFDGSLLLSKMEFVQTCVFLVWEIVMDEENRLITVSSCQKKWLLWMIEFHIEI